MIGHAKMLFQYFLILLVIPFPFFPKTVHPIICL